MSRALRDVEFCVLDLETTGGSSEFEAITEIGADGFLNRRSQVRFFPGAPWIRIRTR